MPKSHEYRLKAADCARKAGAATSADERDRLLRHAQAWLQMADNDEYLRGSLVRVPQDQGRRPN